jgi:ABC-2 type transport system ATP-binding protein
VAAVVSTRGLTKRFGSTTAVDALDLELSTGLVGLVGANGAGKTTLLRLLLGLIRPTAGTVEVCGRDVGQDPVAARARIGYMPESDCLPSAAAASDVVALLGELGGLPARTARQRASQVLDLVGLDEARFRPIGGYSTGMRQRTKLAQALVAGPDLVLLDEPTAGLDPMGRDSMLDVVSRLGGLGITVVMATHLLEDVVRTCDHVVLLDAGRLVSAASTASLVQRTGVVTVDVGPGGAAALVSRLHDRGLRAEEQDDGTAEVTVRDPADLDAVRDAVAGLELPLHRLSSRVSSLDELFTPREPVR